MGIQFTLDGPEIPHAVLAAQEDGRLVIVCGAGISVPAGLPTFSGLVSKIYERLRANPTPLEQAEIDKKNYDRVFNLLEEEGRFRAFQIRHEVIDILSNPSTDDRSTHKAILSLAQSRSGTLRLVTTNFDNLFEDLDTPISHDAAPVLPVPKPHKWSSLVYLHGRIDRDRDPDGINLVLSSSDFGIAYLTERWASRFISQLFSHFIVLFIGYSVDDPVMRYMMDALAAEKRTGGIVQDAFAFTGYSGDNQDHVVSSWKTKHIIPILYNSEDNHITLHESLRVWQEIWAGGLTSKDNIVKETGRKDPTRLPPDEISRFLWALSSDLSGASAITFANLGKAAPLSWLPILETEGLLYKSAPSLSDDHLALIYRDRRMYSSKPLDKKLRALGYWLSEHIHDQDLVRWLISSPFILHPDFALIMRNKVNKDLTLSKSLRTIWSILVNPEASCMHVGPPLGIELLDITTAEWSPNVHLDLVRALTPCLKIRPSFLEAVRDLGENETDLPSSEVVTLNHLVTADCEIRAADYADSLVDSLRNRDDWRSILDDISVDLCLLLRKALYLLQSIGRASDSWDPSYMEHPSIAPHEQNRFYHGWCTIIDLLREAFDNATIYSTDRADLLTALFYSENFPIFRRFSCYAFSKSPTPDNGRLMDYILSSPDQWLWSIQIHVEFFKALPKLWRSLEDQGRMLLISSITDGPPRSMFKENISTEEWQHINDRMIWERLARLHSSGLALTGSSLSSLQEIERRHPQWELTGVEREDFPIWMGSGWGPVTGFPVDEFLSGSPSDIASRIISERRQGDLTDETMLAAVNKDPHKCLEVFQQLNYRRYFDSEIWSRGIFGYREHLKDDEVRKKLRDLLHELPDEGLRSFFFTICDIIYDMAKLRIKPEVPEVLSLWDRCIPESGHGSKVLDGDFISVAINHPTGTLTQAFIEVIRTQNTELRSSFHTDILSRLNLLCSLQGDEYLIAMSILGMHFTFLYDVDPDWASQMLLPKFNWDNQSLAASLWNGFAYSLIIRPSFWPTLKPFFLSSFHNLSSLGKQRSQLYRALPAIAIETGSNLTIQESRECLSRLDDDGLGEVAGWLRDRLEGAGPQAETLWANKVAPWIDKAWPRDAQHLGPKSTVSLLRTALTSSTIFSDAIMLIADLLVPVDRASIIIDDLLSKSFVDLYPEESLELLNRITSDTPNQWFGALGDCLTRIKQARPRLADDNRFARLKDIARNYGL